MSVHVRPMALPELVALVNDWGALPTRVGARETPAGKPAMTAAADRLHAVFATTDGAERARMVNVLLAETAVRPEVAQDDGVLVAGWSVAKPSAALLASAALAVREHLAAHPDRLGVCADHQCADIYVDASPAGHRRFCSTTCHTRARVAAFRGRQRRTRDR